MGEKNLVKYMYIILIHDTIVCLSVHPSVCLSVCPYVQPCHVGRSEISQLLAWSSRHIQQGFH